MHFWCGVLLAQYYTSKTWLGILTSFLCKVSVSLVNISSVFLYRIMMVKCVLIAICLTYINCVPIVVGFSYISNPFYKVSKWHSNATRSQRKTVVSDDDDILNRDCQRQSIYRTQLNTKYNKNTSNHWLQCPSSWLEKYLNRLDHPPVKTQSNNKSHIFNGQCHTYQKLNNQCTSTIDWSV